jgi:hypothetical protein
MKSAGLALSFASGYPTCIPMNGFRPACGGIHEQVTAQVSLDQCPLFALVTEFASG